MRMSGVLIEFVLTLERTKPTCFSRVWGSYLAQFRFLHWKSFVDKQLVVFLIESFPDHRVGKAVFGT